MYFIWTQSHNLKGKSSWFFHLLFHHSCHEIPVWLIFVSSIFSSVIITEWNFRIWSFQAPLVMKSRPHSEQEWLGGTNPSPCILAECSRSLCIRVKPLPQIWQAKFFLSIWILSIWYCSDCLYLNDLWHWWHRNWASWADTGFPLILDVVFSPGLVDGHALFRWCFNKLDCLKNLRTEN